MSQIPMRTADFINTLGVNTHIPYTDGGYANIANIDSDLAYLGVSQVRDAISNGANGSAPLSSYIKLAQEGVKFTCFVGASTTANLAAPLALIATLNTTVPGSVIAVEGPNEINNFAFTYNGVGGLQGAVNFQKDLYSAVHSNPALNHVAVDYFTGYNAGSIAVGPNPQTTSGLADFDTQHPYPNHGQAPLQWVNRAQALGNENPPNGPAVYTETGYSTNGGTGGAVDANVQARYTLDLLMDDAQNGIAQTDLYQLMDAYKPGSPQGDDGYGLFDPANQPKAAATSIHNLTTILADTAANATSFTPTALNYSVTGLPATGHSLELQQSNGATDIVIWNEPPIWNQSSGKEIAAPVTNITVSLDSTHGTVRVFDPLLSATAIQTLSNVSGVTLGLTDHPLILQVEPRQVVTQDTLTLRMSEDAWQGDAQFVVKVDGQQVGGTETASALHATGDSNVFSLTGNWGQNQHSVQIQFLNDAWGGASAMDRNLYIDSIAYDRTSYAGTTAALRSNGTDTFAVGTATPTASAPADLLTVHLSEDAWQGDAQFTLSIDGKQITTPQAVVAQHSAGASQDFLFNGNFGAGTHNLGVAFVNDGWGGTKTTDRNLYVDGIDVNGQHYGNGTTTLLSNGTALFTVPTTH
jgi:hypothetical protein